MLVTTFTHIGKDIRYKKNTKKLSGSTRGSASATVTDSDKWPAEVGLHAENGVRPGSSCTTPPPHLS